MCTNDQNVQVNIYQQNNCEGDSTRSTGGFGQLLALVAGVGGLIWLACWLIGSAASALGKGLSTLSTGISSINWLHVLGGVVLGIVIFIFSAVVLILSVGKAIEYLSTRVERRKARKNIIDLVPIESEEPPQVAGESLKVLPEAAPAPFFVEPQTVQSHGNH
jgi:hypothetical protein